MEWNKNGRWIGGELARRLTSPPASCGPEGRGVQAEYTLDADFVGFAGHFPAFPILPAMMQVLLAQHLLSLARGVWPRLHSIPTAKFLGQIRPGQALLIRGEPTGEGQTEIWDFTLRRSGQPDSTGQDEVVASFRLELR